MILCRRKLPIWQGDQYDPSSVEIAWISTCMNLGLKIDKSALMVRF